MPSLLGMLRQLIKLHRYPCIYVLLKTETLSPGNNGKNTRTDHVALSLYVCVHVWKLMRVGRTGSTFSHTVRFVLRFDNLAFWQVFARRVPKIIIYLFINSAYQTNL